MGTAPDRTRQRDCRAHRGHHPPSAFGPAGTVAWGGPGSVGFSRLRAAGGPWLASERCGVSSRTDAGESIALPSFGLDPEAALLEHSALELFDLISGGRSLASR